MSQDHEHFPELSRRQEEILSAIVHAYTRQPEPVSSKHLAEGYEIGVSSATIRNEMAKLDEMGYLEAPHTSAGRIPTALGYRYFVRRLLKNGDLGERDQRYIAQNFDPLPTAIDQWMRQAATTLARTATSASLVTPPIADVLRFKHIELIAIQGRLALMVLVLEGGMVHQRMLTLADNVPQATLSESADHINSLCADCNANQMRLRALQLPLLEREVVEVAAELMENSAHQPRQIYRDGLSEVINAFSDNSGAQQVVRVFEERAFLSMILTEILAPSHREGDDIQVIIAGDGRWDELDRVTLVLTRYGIPGEIGGTLGVIGPTHINYGRAISSVRYVASLMSEMLIKLYDEEQREPDDDPPDEGESPAILPDTRG